MYAEDFLIPLGLMSFLLFAVFGFISIISSDSGPDDFIPVCNPELYRHWSVHVPDANEPKYAEPVVNKFIALGWSNITAEIHNGGVSDRINADCN